MRRRTWILGVFLLALGVLPAAAEDWSAPPRDQPGARWAIYQLENRIAYLEADPDMDDVYKAYVIAQARREIRRLRATLMPARWPWLTTCCYSRPTLYLR